MGDGVERYGMEIILRQRYPALSFNVDNDLKPSEVYKARLPARKIS
jgi:hypothetical protein